jgi:hypothetical protein
MAVDSSFVTSMGEDTLGKLGWKVEGGEDVI